MLHIYEMSNLHGEKKEGPLEVRVWSSELRLFPLLKDSGKTLSLFEFQGLQL